jgi:hypothetical protein
MNMRLEELLVDPEFEGLLRKQNEDEAKEMAASIAAHGYLSPIIVWDGVGKDGKGVIIDGHHRHKYWKASYDAWKLQHAEWRKEHAEWLARRPGAIARSLGSKEVEEPKEPKEPSRPDMVRMQFADRESVKAFIGEHQAARRNMTEFELSVIRGRQFHVERDNGATYQESAAKVASEHGVSPATVIRDAALSEALDELKEDDPDIEGKCSSDDAPSRASIVTAGSLRKTIKAMAKATHRSLDQVLDETKDADGRTMRETLKSMITPKRMRLDGADPSGPKPPVWQPKLEAFEKVLARIWDDESLMSERKIIKRSVQAMCNRFFPTSAPQSRQTIKQTIMGQVVPDKAVAE